MEQRSVRLKLDTYMKEHGISKNRLTREARLQRSQLISYCRNDVTRLDLSVLGRICSALGCEAEDILEVTKEQET